MTWKLGRRNLQFADTIKRAKDFIAGYDATLAMSNKLNAAIYCFRGKNIFGMKDVQEIHAVAGDDATKPQNVDEILNALPGSPNEVEIINEAEE